MRPFFGAVSSPHQSNRAGHLDPGHLGAQNVARMASRLNVSQPDLLAKLAELLPQHVDQMTPDGVIPNA